MITLNRQQIYIRISDLLLKYLFTYEIKISITYYISEKIIVMKSNQKVIVGQLVINGSVPRQKIMKALTSKNRSYVRESQWQFPNYQFSQSDCVQLLRISDQCTVEKLNVWNNNLKLILELIIPVDWPKLKELILSNNRIQSIQRLQSLSFPNLLFLDLSNNRITTIFSFRKFVSPSLKTLQILENPLIQLKGFEMIDCNLKCLDIFGHQVRANSYSQLFKYLTRHLKRKPQDYKTTINANDCFISKGQLKNQIESIRNYSNVQIMLINI